MLKVVIDTNIGILHFRPKVVNSFLYDHNLETAIVLTSMKSFAFSLG